MNIIYLIWAFLFFCPPHKEALVNLQQGGNVLMKIEEIQNAQLGDHIPINLIIYNHNNFSVLINDPSCWVSSLPMLHFEGESAITMIKVKVNPACVEHLVKIKKNDSVSIQYDFLLDRVFKLDKLGTYTLQFSYTGKLYSNEGKQIRELKLLTRKISFMIKK